MSLILYDNTNSLWSKHNFFIHFNSLLTSHLCYNGIAHCTDPFVVGPCRASFSRWYYDPLKKKCHRFTYGGCNGNENNFETSDKCMDDCSGVSGMNVLKFQQDVLVMMAEVYI